MTNFDYQILRLLLQNRKAEATSFIFEKTHILSQAKEQISILEKRLDTIHKEPKLILIVLENMLQNTKIRGIKELKEYSNLGLKESKDLYEQIQEKLENEDIEDMIHNASIENIQEPESVLRYKIIEVLLTTNSKLKAVKYAKEKLNIGLKEALNYVEEIQQNM